MPLIQFVRNYEDLSTNRGFQFKFHCDKCGNGYMTHFQASALGIAESVLSIAGNVFGGVFATARNSAYEVQRAVGGTAHDAALEAAVQEGKEYFHQCTRCGHWVCPDVCWNGAASMCEQCAPNFQEELVAAHARAKSEAALAQLRQKAAKTDYVADVDMAANAVLATPQAAASAHEACAGCGASLALGVHFCPQCGAPRPPAGCAGCGAPFQANAKFCARCGAKVAAGPA